MRESPPPSPAGPAEGPVSDRVRLAGLAVEAALRVNGVAEAHSPPSGGASTGSSRGPRIDGVSVVMGAGGRYDVSLHLVARAVPLLPVADRVRDRVASAARRAGLGERLGPVDVRFEDLAEP